MAKFDLTRLFTKHASNLQRSLQHKTQDSQLAADLMQEGFVRLAEQQQKQVIHNAPGFLYRVANNLLMDYFRQHSRQKTDCTEPMHLHQLLDERCDVPEQLAASQQLEQIQQALSELPLCTQQIFQLARLDGLSYQEIAAQLKVSESTVQKHLASALTYLLARSHR